MPMQTSGRDTDRSSFVAAGRLPFSIAHPSLSGTPLGRTRKRNVQLMMANSCKPLERDTVLLRPPTFCRSWHESRSATRAGSPAILLCAGVISYVLLFVSASTCWHTTLYPIKGYIPADISIYSPFISLYIRLEGSCSMKLPVIMGKY